MTRYVLISMLLLDVGDGSYGLVALPDAATTTPIALTDFTCGPAGEDAGQEIVDLDDIHVFVEASRGLLAV